MYRETRSGMESMRMPMACAIQLCNASLRWAHAMERSRTRCGSRMNPLDDV